MNQIRKNRIIRISYLMNALLFFLGGFEFLGNDRLFFAIIQFVASSLNLIGVIVALNPMFGFRFKQSLLVIDIFVAMSVAVYYSDIGKQYIQYAWAVASIMSLVALIILSRKERSKRKQLEE